MSKIDEISPKKESMIDATKGLKREKNLIKMIMYFGKDSKQSDGLASFEDTLSKENEINSYHIMDYMACSSDEKMELDPLFVAVVSKFQAYAEAFTDEETLKSKAIKTRLRFEHDLDSDLYKMICWYISGHSNEYYEDIVNELLGNKKEQYFNAVIRSIIETSLSFNDKIFVFRNMAIRKPIGPQIADDDLTLLTDSNDISKINLVYVIQMMKMNLCNYYNVVSRDLITSRYQNEEEKSNILSYDDDKEARLRCSNIGKLMFLLIQTATYINAVKRLGGTVDTLELDNIIPSIKEIIIKSRIKDASYIIPALDDITELADKLADQYAKEFTK